MTEEISEEWNRTMSGREIDPIDFINLLFRRVLHSGSVSGRILAGATKIEFKVHNEDPTQLTGDAAAGKFRMMLARLVVLFVGKELYGGKVVADFRHDGRAWSAEMEFVNKPDAWFVITRTREGRSMTSSPG